MAAPKTKHPGPRAELIELDSPRGRRAAALATAATALAGLILAATGALEIALPPSKLRLVGDEADRAKRAEADLSWRDGSRARNIETNFGLHGRVRRYVAPYWATLMLSLRDVPSRRLVVGSDDYLFFRDRIDLKPEARDRGTAILSNLLSLVRRSLLSQGTTLIAAPVPRKAVACEGKLPPGIDVAPDYDASVVAALQARGVPTLDLLPAWTAPGSARFYLTHDSHWSRAGVASFAAELAQQFPMLPRNEGTFELLDGPMNVTIGVLAHAGIFPRHPAYALAEPGNEPGRLLQPEGREARLDAGEEPSRITLAGSSFCEGFFAQANLAHALQAPVADFSIKGRPPLASLHRAITSRPRSEQPPFAIHEFPVHQVATVSPGAGTIHRAAFAIVDHLEGSGGTARGEPLAPRALNPIDDKRFPWRQEEQIQPGKPWVRFPGGSLLTSGDGVFRARLSVESDQATRWRVATNGMTLAFKIAPGQGRTLPVIESAPSSGVLWVAPLDENAVAAARSGQARVEIVTEADWGRGRRLPGKASGDDSGWSLEGCAEPVEALDCLVAQWETSGPRAPLEVEIEGLTAAGASINRTWSFRRCGGARLLCLSTGAFEGGLITSVRVTGPPQAQLGSMEVRLAPGLSED